MANKHGAFIWYELMTRDPDAAKAFYDDVVGWNIGQRLPGDMPMGDIGMYRFLDHCGARIGAVSPYIGEGGSPAWTQLAGQVTFDGVTGLSKFRELNPDLVILDLMLPVLDGLEVGGPAQPGGGGPAGLG
jgi:catechol 2,3-dioxygenase-like lactoylglutathione lyase family enzyme